MGVDVSLWNECIRMCMWSVGATATIFQVKLRPENEFVQKLCDGFI